VIALWAFNINSNHEIDCRMDHADMEFVVGTVQREERIKE
jgi:hypothetical protein